MAEQVKLPIPALPVPSRYAKRMKMVQEKKAASQQRKRETCKTRIYIGVAFDRWQTLKVSKRLKSDAELAVLLLDCYERNDLQSTPLTASATTSIMQEVVPSSATRSCTSDPDTSAPILTEVIGYTDESDSSDEEENTMVSDHSSDSDGLKQAGLKLRQLCPECGKRFNIQKTHTCESKLKPFSCTVCGKRFVTEHYLKIHSKIHNEGCEHVCKFCFSTFKTKLDKIVHEQSHPRVKKPFQCPDCPEVFAKRKERNNHMMGHRGPKKYICHICNMEFPHTSALERHVVVHTGEKQFVCEVCQRSFSQTGHLKSHMRVHTGEKPYQCQHCDKSFNHNVSLKSHIKHYHGKVPDPGMMEKTTRNQSEPEAEKNKMNEMENNTVDVRETHGATLMRGRKKRLCATINRKKKRLTGRPKGRPQINKMIASDATDKLKRKLCDSDESWSNSDSVSDSADE